MRQLWPVARTAGINEFKMEVQLIEENKEKTM